MAQEHKHGKFYHGPMPVHVPEFVADTMHLETEEFGAYWALILHGWESLGIPKDLRRVAAITKLPRRRIKAVWEILSPFWQDEHPSCGLCLVSPRQERVREAERLRIEISSEATSETRRNAAAERQRRHRMSQNVTPGKRDKSVTRAENVTQRNAQLALAGSDLETSSPPETPSITSPTGSLRSPSGDASGQAPDAQTGAWQERLREAARALSEEG